MCVCYQGTESENHNYKYLIFWAYGYFQTAVTYLSVNWFWLLIFYHSSAFASVCNKIFYLIIVLVDAAIFLNVEHFQNFVIGLVSSSV